MMTRPQFGAMMVKNKAKGKGAAKPKAMPFGKKAPAKGKPGMPPMMQSIADKMTGC